MSDSIRKYYELVEEGAIKDIAPTKDTDKQAYTILSIYDDAAILKAAAILGGRK